MSAAAPGSRPCFFFFQAEDGIRDLIVTGVQTCALPIYDRARLPRLRAADGRDHRERTLRGPQAGRARERSLSRETVMNYSLQGKAAIVTGGDRKSVV